MIKKIYIYFWFFAAMCGEAVTLLWLKPSILILLTGIFPFVFGAACYGVLATMYEAEKYINDTYGDNPDIR